MSRLFHPATWASLIPNGVGEVKPHHILEIFKTAWNNRDELGFAWRILNNGVCDGCALGTTGMKDFTMDGVHLCTVRLNLLKLNTMPAVEDHFLQQHEMLSKMTAKELRHLGRLPYPMLWRRGEPGYRRITWDEAFATMADKIRAVDPDRLAFYLTSRGITNEVYYMAQKVARFLGTNNVDNSARTCHASSTTGLKTTLGVAASTCSYKDWIGTDLLVFLGSNVPNNQPVTTKYIYYAKTQGAHVSVINAYREPGLERYWVPSVMESALFGTKIADDFTMVHTGGDLAFLNGVLKHIIEIDALHHDFIDQHTTGFDQVVAHLATQTWSMLEQRSGATREQMKAFGDRVAKAKSAVFVWSMGITQHPHGVQNVQAIANLALSQGFVGREHCGLMPIRGHSGVQGGAEVGCVPSSFPGSRPVQDDTAAALSESWGFQVPTEPGLIAPEMIDAAHRGDLDLLYSVGGNFLETLPDPDYVREALARVPMRVHQDIVLSPQMFVEPQEVSLILPGQTRYEQRGGGTETTTERQIIFSPEIPGRRIGESLPEWEILMEMAARTHPERKAQIWVDDAAQIRRDIARDVPFYEGIESLEKKGDHVQWGGRHLCVDGQFPTPSGKANFLPLTPPERELPANEFWVSTRRGKQFNSMVQSDYDALTGTRRDDILIHRDDIKRLGLTEGQSVVLRSDAGTYQGRLKAAEIRPQNLQVHWPEGNTLLSMGEYQPQCGIPNYNARVRVEPLPQD